MRAHHRQYLVAILVAFGLCIAQAWSVAKRFGLAGLHPRTDVMQQQVAEHMLDNPRLGATVVLFVVLVLASHLLLTVASVGIYRSATRVVMRGKRDQLWPCMGWLAMTLLLAMFANCWLFPMSSAFAGVEVLMIQPLSPLLIVGMIGVMSVALACAAYAWLSQGGRRLWAAGVACACVLLVTGWHRLVPSANDRVMAAQPDIIILGVDSLRPDYLGAYGPIPEGLAPSIDAAMQASVMLADAKTPMARTFVSYQSLFTGRNPIGHGARFNLYPRTEFSSKETLAWQLKERGYSTMLAMDESRFANFDASFGFDTTVVPRVGALDFVVGGTFDFLATNLLIAAIPASAWMSPIQGNRAAFRSYRTNDHSQRLNAALRAVPAERPLFLVSHLCLPHWPYLPGYEHAGASLAWVKAVPGYEESSTQYLRAVAAADRQFAEVLAELRRLGRLDNAIVVILSDHGEDFALQRDRLWVDEVGGRQLGAHGHGSFALSNAQNHIVMGIQRYRDGKPFWTPRVLQGAASIIDVAPTIAAEVGMQEEGYEGVSWLPMLRGGGDLPKDRVRYFENGLRSAGVERADINENEVAAEMSYLYRVTEDGRFEVRPELLPQKLQEKQRGATLGRWGVMTDPVSSSALGAGNCWQALDYEQRVIGCVDFPAMQPDVAALQQEVCRYYAADAGFAQRWCQPSAISAVTPVASH